MVKIWNKQAWHLYSLGNSLGPHQLMDTHAQAETHLHNPRCQCWYHPTCPDKKDLLAFPWDETHISVNDYPVASSICLILWSAKKKTRPTSLIRQQLTSKGKKGILWNSILQICSNRSVHMIFNVRTGVRYQDGCCQNNYGVLSFLSNNDRFRKNQTAEGWWVILLLSGISSPYWAVNLDF